MSMIAKDLNNIQRSVKCDTDGTLLVGGITISSVTVSIIPSTSIIAYNEEPIVLSSITTTLLDYTNTTGGLVLMDGWTACGNMTGEFEMFINGTKNMKRRSSEQNRNCDFFVPTPIRIENNSFVTIKVTQYDTASASFECSLFGHRT